MRQLFVVLPVFTCMALFSAGSFAGWSDSSSVNTPVCLAANDQEFPEAIPDGSGGVIVAWSDKRSSTANADVYAQRLDANGNPLWGESGLPVCLAPGNQDGVVLVADGSGGALVLWVDRRSGDPDIYAQRISAAGALLWAPTGIPVVQASGVQSEIVAGEDGSGGAVVAWQDLRNDAGDVFVQRLSGSGTVLWTPGGVPVCTSAGPQYHVATVPDEDGGAFVTWADERTGDADVYLQRLSPSGVAAWTANGIPVVQLPEQHYEPAIVRDGDDGVIVAWIDWRSTDTDIYAQRVSGSGTARWTANGVIVSHVVQNQLSLHADGAGGALVGLVNSDGNSLNVYASRLDSTGAAAWSPPVSLLSTGDPAQLGSMIQMLPGDDGGGIVVWADSRTGPGWDLYAQRFDETGVPLWDSSGMAVSIAALFQGSQKIVSDNRGGAIVVFQDNRSGLEEDIYAQRIGADGMLSSPTAIPVRQGWNLVSLPRQVGSVFVDSLFEANHGKFSFDGVSYTPSDSLQAGAGIWVKFSAPALFELEGPAIQALSVTCPHGNTWVLLGALTDPVPASILVSNPPGAVQAGPYRYGGSGYVSASHLNPGEAYWVFVNQPCVLTLSRP